MKEKNIFHLLKSSKFFSECKLNIRIRPVSSRNPGDRDRDFKIPSKKSRKFRGSGFEKLEKIPKIPKFVSLRFYPRDFIPRDPGFFQSRDIYSRDSCLFQCRDFNPRNFQKSPGFLQNPRDSGFFRDYLSSGSGFFVGWDIPTKSRPCLILTG